MKKYNYAIKEFIYNTEDELVDELNREGEKGWEVVKLWEHSAVKILSSKKPKNSFIIKVLMKIEVYS